MLRHAGDQAQVLGLAQPFGRDRALGLEGDAAVPLRIGRAARRRTGRSARATVKSHVTAQQARLGARDREAAFVQGHYALEFAQLGRGRRELHVIAGQGDGALDPRFVDGMDGQLQAEAVVTSTAGHGLGQHLVGHAAHR